MFLTPKAQPPSLGKPRRNHRNYRAGNRSSREAFDCRQTLFEHDEWVDWQVERSLGEQPSFVGPVGIEPTTKGL